MTTIGRKQLSVVFFFQSIIYRPRVGDDGERMRDPAREWRSVRLVMGLLLTSGGLSTFSECVRTAPDMTGLKLSLDRSYSVIFTTFPSARVC